MTTRRAPIAIACLAWLGLAGCESKQHAAYQRVATIANIAIDVLRPDYTQLMAESDPMRQKSECSGTALVLFRLYDIKHDLDDIHFGDRIFGDMEYVMASSMDKCSLERADETCRTFCRDGWMRIAMDIERIRFDAAQYGVDIESLGWPGQPPRLVEKVNP